MAKTYRTPSVVVLGNADVLTMGFAVGNTKEHQNSTSISMLDL
jgi:hypothetical protein